VPLPPDGHVHTEWSWDTRDGSMERACARAAELGLPSIAFTDHADFGRWITRAGRPVTAPPLDAPAYLACVQRCRDLLPGLRILAGAELGEPHWHAGEVSDLLSRGGFDRILGSVHSIEADGVRVVNGRLYDWLEPGELMRAYLGEALRLASSPAPFAVLAHIDYPVRYWPARAGRFDPGAGGQHCRAAGRPDRPVVARGGRRRADLRE
jgi:histidinol-phosphatase (PHP family)